MVSQNLSVFEGLDEYLSLKLFIEVVKGYLYLQRPAMDVTTTTVAEQSKEPIIAREVSVER